MYLADYATAEDGTGIVHSSPAYGVDDFNSCVAHGLKHDDILNPVQGNGVYDDRAAAVRRPRHLEGQRRRSSRRCATPAACSPADSCVHSYPHCWRHKTPVIYRAAAQWFVRMDEGDGVFTVDKAPKTLRQTALEAIDAVSFYPENGRARLRDMIANRPDWCISRQRNWGVPLPFFLHKESGELHPRHARVHRPRGRRSSSTAASRPGARLDAARVARAPMRPSTTPRATTSSTSGSIRARRSSTCCAARIPQRRHDSGPEADLYLEGHDQHRGWFHSSLLIACAIEGHAPYRGLLTHGFTVDGRAAR